jgi:hypothetical protein
MPLSFPPSRREIHHRSLDMKAYARDDGLYDVEGHLTDRKPFDFQRVAHPAPTPAGQALHDLWIRLTVDDDYTVRAIEAASDVTPHALCKEAEVTLGVLVGERLASGWSSKVKERLRGAASCTHLMEMLIPLATTALQGIRARQRMRAGARNPHALPVRLDSCYAYAAHRDVVMKFWPQHFRPAKAAGSE